MKHPTPIKTIYFSPTGGTGKIAKIFSDELSRCLSLMSGGSDAESPNSEGSDADGPNAETPDAEVEFFDVTTPEAREEELHFSRDFVVVAMPTYAGRLPNKILPDLKRIIKSDGSSIAVAIAVFGNRSPGDAPRELALLLKENGFKVVGMNAFVSRHAFSDKVGEGRPDEEDERVIKAFATEIAEKLCGAGDAAACAALEITWDESDIIPYYTPLKEDLTPASFLKAKPVLDPEKCTGCGICKASCPVGSIEEVAIDETTLEETMIEKTMIKESRLDVGENRGKIVFETHGICIKCQACIRKCPANAREFKDEEFLSHVRMLEGKYSGRER